MTLLAQSCDHKLGQILIEQNILTEQNLSRVLDIQQRNKKNRFGDYLVENHNLRRDEIEATLKNAENNSKFPKSSKIGEILISSGITSREQVNTALINQQNAKNEKIGSLLIKNGLINEEQLLPALAQKLRVPLLDLEEKPPSTIALETLPQKTATRMGVVPVEYRDKTIVVATTDPTDLVAERYLRFITGCTVKMALASSKQIFDVHRRAYDGGREELDELNRDGIGEVELIGGKNEDKASRETDPTVIKLVNRVLLTSVGKGSTHIHFEPGPGDLKISRRTNGEHHLVCEIPKAFRKAVFTRLKTMANLDISECKKPQSGKILLQSNNKKLEYWIETTPTVGGQEDAILRFFANSKPIPLNKLGLSDDNLKKCRVLLTKPNGIILSVGPRKSGKTTSIHAALKEIATPKRKIWTVEDPVEIIQPGLRQVQVNHQTGLTFSHVLQSFMRADPDVIMIGEIDDASTARMAIDASFNGRLVFGTLETNNAAETLNRFIELGLEPTDFSEALLGILSQRLVLKLCESCKEAYNPDFEEYEELTRSYGLELSQLDKIPIYSDDLLLMRKKGCLKCDGTGYLGKTGIHELLVFTDNLSRLIANRQDVLEMYRMSARDNMRLLRMDGIQKVFQGITSYDQVAKVCT
jgi:type II secretory ATPase GspE/PulE/Tfp pilus assembly ATPase PilB-like protein